MKEKLFTTEEIKGADAAFFCGTASEVIGWESLDGVKFKKEWNESLSRVIQLAFKNRVVEKPIEEFSLKSGELV